MKLSRSLPRVLLITTLLSVTLSWVVRPCDQPATPLPFYSVDGQPDSTTFATICHDGANLNIIWDSIDKEVISTYQKCNDPLYNMDAVEIFIATEGTYPKTYYEFEVSPRGVLFFADITNPLGTCSQLETFYYLCSSVSYGATLTGDGWRGWMSLPLLLIGRGTKPDVLLVNLFRIDKSSSLPTRYLAWQPTYTSPPCFHKPKYF